MLSCKPREKSKAFFPQENFNSSAFYFSTLFPNCIHILLTQCTLLTKQILFTPKITSQNGNNASQFLKKNSRLRRAKILAAPGIFIAKIVFPYKTIGLDKNYY